MAQKVNDLCVVLFLSKKSLSLAYLYMYTFAFLGNANLICITLKIELPMLVVIWSILVNIFCEENLLVYL
jgi:hypothetical protein